MVAKTTRVVSGTGHHKVTLAASSALTCPVILGSHSWLTWRNALSSVSPWPVSLRWWLKEMMYRSWCILVVGISLLTLCSVAQAEYQPAKPSESSLEPEFRQLRAKLSVLPEFSGTDADSKFRLAQELARRGDVQGAVESYRAAIHLKADWADPYRGLGQVLLDHHDYPEAVEALQSSIRLGRDDHQAFYWLGRAYMGKGELAAAAVALERSIQLKEDDAEAFADLGLVRMAKGDMVGAEAALSQSIKLKPDYAEAHRLQEVLKRNRREQPLVMKEAQAILHDLFARE
jgi:tetratricopeptide (TPR) repeat protein